MAREISPILLRFVLLRNTSKCSVRRDGQQYHLSCHCDHITDHTAITRGYTRTTRMPVKTGQRHPKGTVAALFSLQLLQTPAICFNLLQNCDARKCNNLQWNASK